MAAERYRHVPKALWAYLNPALKGIDADLTAIETNTGGTPRDQITPNSPHSDVAPWLPDRDTPTKGILTTVNRVHVNASTAYPTQVSWTSPDLLSIRVQNPTDSNTNINIGYGTYNSPNHVAEPDIVPPGSEWVGTASALPVFVRTDTGSFPVTVITTRKA